MGDDISIVFQLLCFSSIRFKPGGVNTYPQWFGSFFNFIGLARGIQKETVQKTKACFLFVELDIRFRFYSGFEKIEGVQ